MDSIHPPTKRPPRPTRKHPKRDTGKIHVLIPVLILSILTIAGGSIWYFRAVQAGKQTPAASETGIRLSESTRNALKRLKSPVEIRFYSLLAADDGPDPLRAFSGRVDRLLSGYEQEAGGNIILTSFRSRSNEDLDAAAADGLQVFNLAEGEAKYLGLSVVQKDQQEALARITPEWEGALEADLTRAILRVSGARSGTKQTATAAQAASDAGEDVKRAIPDYASVPLEDGRQILRGRAFKELKAAAVEMQTQIKEAQQRLREAQTAGSEAGQEAAMQQVKQAQAAQTEKLKEISARLDAQLKALERLKTTPQDAGTR